MYIYIYIYIHICIHPARGQAPAEGHGLLDERDLRDVRLLVELLRGALPLHVCFVCVV